MQVLGDLISLPNNEKRGLPLPWWHRAPLGLSNNTSVFVALTVPSKNRPAPDLIVTVLDPSKWNRMFQVNCLQEDRPGIVAEVIKRVYPLNIALAETVKLESGNVHQVSLICEPAFDQQNVKDQISRIKDDLKKAGFRCVIKNLPPLPPLQWNRVGTVEHGWVKGVSWKQEISSGYPQNIDGIDLSRVVVSADTESRVLRYVFPRFGAVTVSIKHADSPGALGRITEALKACNLNILSAFLRRGGGMGLDAELVAVCEPKDKTNVKKIDSLRQIIGIEIRKIPQNFRVEFRINSGREAEEAIYSKHPDEIVARVPANLSRPVQEIREGLGQRPDGRRVTPIFISRRFPQSSGKVRILEDVRDTLRDNGCIPIEADPTIGRDPNTIYEEVSSKMWASKAGMVLIIKVPEGRPISYNLTHELGFLTGQGKKVIVLIQNIPECLDVMKDFTNYAGVRFQPFDPEVGKEEPGSIQSHIVEFLKYVNNE